MSYVIFKRITYLGFLKIVHYFTYLDKWKFCKIYSSLIKKVELFIQTLKGPKITIFYQIKYFCNKFKLKNISENFKFEHTEFTKYFLCVKSARISTHFWKFRFFKKDLHFSLNRKIKLHFMNLDRNCIVKYNKVSNFSNIVAKKNNKGKILDLIVSCFIIFYIRLVFILKH